MYINKYSRTWNTVYIKQKISSVDAIFDQSNWPIPDMPTYLFCAEIEILRLTSIDRLDLTNLYVLGI